MPHPDENKSFEDIFSSCMYDVLREFGVALSNDKLEQFQITCKKAAKRLEFSQELASKKLYSKFQDRVSQAFAKVQEDIFVLQTRCDDIESPSPLVENPPQIFQPKIEQGSGDDLSMPNTCTTTKDDK